MKRRRKELCFFYIKCVYVPTSFPFHLGTFSWKYKALLYCRLLTLCYIFGSAFTRGLRYGVCTVMMLILLTKKGNISEHWTLHNALLMCTYTKRKKKRQEKITDIRIAKKEKKVMTWTNKDQIEVGPHFLLLLPLRNCTIIAVIILVVDGESKSDRKKVFWKYMFLLFTKKRKREMRQIYWWNSFRNSNNIFTDTQERKNPLFLSLFLSEIRWMKLSLLLFPFTDL